MRPVGSFPDDCSPYGVLDMAGNQIELCVDPMATDGWCVSRGGCFGYTEFKCTCASERRMGTVTVWTPNCFRVVKEPPR